MIGEHPGTGLRGRMEQRMERRTNTPDTNAERTVRAEGTEASAVATIAGTPARVGRAHRRGTFLVLVVGVLALLAVVAILYASIGMGDRQRVAALQRSDELQKYPDAVRDYVAGIIADAALAPVWDHAGTGPVTNYTTVDQIPSKGRAAWDSPSTSYLARSALTGAPVPQGTVKFDPTGSPRVDATMPRLPSTWIPSSPWLASTTPTHLGDPADVSDPDRPYLFARDWAQVSSVAPDGHFVNLYNLRGNFNASPRAMMNNLFLLRRPPGWATERLSQRTPQTDFGVAADVNVPAHWSARQAGAYQPALDLEHNGDSPEYLLYQWADADGDGYVDSRITELTDVGLGTFPIPRTEGVRYFVAVRIVDASGLINVNTAGDLMAAPTEAAPLGASPAELDLRRALMMTDAYENYALSGNPVGYDGLFRAGTTPANPPTASVENVFTEANARFIGQRAYDAIRLAIASGTAIPSANPTNTTDEFLGVNLAPPATNPTSFAALYRLDIGADRRRWDFETPNITPTGGVTPVSASVARSLYYGTRLDTLLNAFNTADANRPLGFRGWFGLDDLYELHARSGLNDASITSALEATVDGRTAQASEIAASNPPLDEARYHSPLLNNAYPAALLTPTGRLAREALNRAAVESDLLYRAISPRPYLTTVNGAREIRSGWSAKAGAMPAGSLNLATLGETGWSDSELRVNIPSVLDALNPPGPQTPPSRLATVNPNRSAEVGKLLNVIFDSYADALLPYSSEAGSWRRAEMRTLAYGHRGPELALHAAAHLTLNLADMHDDNQIPSAATVIVDEDYRSDLSNQATQNLTHDDRPFPFWIDLGGASRPTVGLDLNYEAARAAGGGNVPQNQNRLASENAGDAVTAKAVNIFGIEAQPFITSACSFAVYTDTPRNAALGRNGDNEDQQPVTIDGRIDRDNPDFLFRVVAFQLTNPFNVDVTLAKDEAFQVQRPGVRPDPNNANLQLFDVGQPGFWALDRLRDFQYIRFSGRTFPLVRMIEERNLVLQSDADTAQANGVPHKFEDESVGGYYTTLNGPTDGVDIRVEPITIPAGQSIVVYAISGIPRQILQQRYQNAAVTLPSGNPDAYRIPGTIENVIAGHIRGQGISAMYWIPEMDPATGLPAMIQDGGGTPQFYDNEGLNGDPNQVGIFGPLVKQQGSSGRPPENSVIELWRALRTGRPGSGQGQGPNTTQDDAGTETVQLPSSFWDNQTGSTQRSALLNVRNNTANDLLVDRFRLPPDDDANFDVRLRPSGASASTRVEIENTIARNPDGSVRDDTGYTLTLFSSARRPADPRGNSAGTGVPLGAIPAYCLERKDPGAGNAAWNRALASAISRTRPDKNDFDGTHRYAQERLEEWRRRVVGGSIVGDVATAPNRQDTNRISNQPVPAWLATNPNWQRPAYDRQYPEIALDDHWFHSDTNVTTDPYGGRGQGPSRLRLIDVLRPMAIGPMQDPLFAITASGTPPAFWPGATVSDVEWTTLGEMLALTLGYETRPLPPASAGAAISLYYPEPPPQLSGSGADYPSNTSPRPFDRGQLVLDDYVPFFDADGDGVLDRTTGGAVPETPRGPGIPLALNAFDVFTVRPVRTDRANPGVVNAGTAPLQVLRLVPGLSPTDRAFNPTVSPQRNPWVGPGGTTFDAAAMIAAFRDKAAPNFRASFFGAIPVVGFGDFRDSVVGGRPDQYFSSDNAREQGTGIVGITELPGITSPGSILAARWRVMGQSQSQVDQLASTPGNIDALGAINPGTGPANHSVLGVTTAGYTKTTGSGTNRVANDIDNDYEEKLAIASGALGTLTNRSDVFICWYLVQGFTPDDVAIRAGDTSPMTPSIQRRFMMVVDRSNVQKKGDKPRILLFKEVPL